MTVSIWIVTYLAAINASTFLAFAWDKRQARKDGSRISESALLKLALLGGSFGAKIGQRKFRHKTLTQPFSRQLDITLWLQIALFCAAVFWLVADIRQHQKMPGQMTRHFKL